MDKVIHLDSHQLSYATAGREESPALIMIHGLMSYQDVWAQTMQVFKLSHYCVTMDLLGFGSSPKPDNGNYSIEAQAQRVVQLADSLNLGCFDLVGHSMGSQIALYIGGITSPGRVNKLIAISPVVTGKFSPYVENILYPTIALAARAPALYRLANRLSNYRLFAFLLFRPWFNDMYKIPFDSWAIDRDMALQRDVHLSTYKSLLAMRARNLTPNLPNITAPTLAIVGKQDRSIPVSEANLIHKHVPTNLVQQIDQCGHFPMYEQRDIYLDNLLAFLR